MTSATYKSDSVDLIERLEKATGPSRVLDFEIHLACVGDPIWPAHDLSGRMINPDARMSDYLRIYRDVIDSDDQDFEFPRYTASIDAALTLVDQDRHFVEHIGQVPAGWDAKISDKILDNLSWEGVEASAPATALCVAALKARQCAA